MANFAIEVRVGPHPSNYVKGAMWHISDGEPDSKISPETLMEIIALGIENEFKKRGMEKFVSLERRLHK